MKTFNTFVSEQILDELNKDTLYSYAKKSEADLNKKHKELASQVRTNNAPSANKTYLKISKRYAGMDKAESRLNKESSICPHCAVDPCLCDDSHGFVSEALSPPSLEVHRIAVTTSEPDHHMVSKRKETTQRFVRVASNNNKHAIDTAINRFKERGYKVHGAEHVGIIKESADDHYAESEAHLNKASKALEISDMAAHHFHMSNHHEAKGRWHEDKGRHSSADREYAKAEEHHEKGLTASKAPSRTLKSEESINELSSDTLQSYKEKAKKSADTLTSKGKHSKAADRWLNVMKATGKQIDKTTAGIKKALNKEEVDKGEYDYEGQMARGQLQTTLRNCKDLIDMIEDDENMPEWVQSKITLAQDYITTVRDYMQSKEELGEN